MTNNYKGRSSSTYLLVRFLAKIAISLAGVAVLDSTSRFKIEIDDSVKKFTTDFSLFFGNETVQ